MNGRKITVFLSTAIMSVIIAYFIVLKIAFLNDYANTWRLFTREETNDDRIVVVLIDGNSALQKYEDGSLKRSEYAKAISHILRGNPKVIGVDVFFAGIKDLNDDIKLIEALELSERSIVLAIYPFEDADLIIHKIKGNASRSYTYKNISVGDVWITHGNGAVTLSSVTPVRGMSIGQEYLPFPIEIVRQYLGGADYKQNQMLENKILVAILGDLKIPAYGHDMLVNYIGGAEAFNSIRFENLMKTEPSAFHNRIVLIGHSTGDNHVTPISINTPGIIIHANTINTILTKQFLSVVDLTVHIFVVFIVCVTFSCATILVRPVYKLLLFASTLVISKIFIDFLFVRHKIYFPFTTLLIGLLLTFCGIMVFTFLSKDYRGS